MTELENPPAQLGAPCWTPDAVGRAISPIARLSPALESYFLATHAPNERLWDVKHNGALTEAEFYERLFDVNRTNVFAIVRGDPGTGKSHLIRWLHLRCTIDITAKKLENVLPVLVQRRSGNLRDALTQIVEQLPPQFERHLRQIREAMENLSEDRARHALAGALQLQLLEAPVPPTLRNLHEVCLSPGFRQWLIRPNGVIDCIVRQLTQDSDGVARESLPVFTAAEFAVPSQFSQNNAPSVQYLIEELNYLLELREQAAAFFNAASRPAVKTMSGLIGSGLRDVFDAIRRDLRGEGKRLALFVEDVSVMASLDEDVLNAVEPNPDPVLGELVAVVGMTDTGFNVLAENLVSRTTEIVGVGLDAAKVWLDTPQELSRFSARYLNVLRLPKSRVAAVAADRLRGDDVTHSACSPCPVRESCHTIFGAVSFDDVDVGLFPFTETALHRLFGGLNEGMVAIRKNPRGLLEHILTPVLHDYGALRDHLFPRARLSVELDEPAYWSAFEAKYLGGWSVSEQKRLKGFAQAWIQAAGEDDAARVVQPFLVPLGFRPFSTGVNQTPLPAVQRSQSPVAPQSVMEPQAEREELRQLRNEIGRWAEGMPLENDDKPRELLLDFLKHAIAWDDEPVPVRVYDKLLKNKAHIKFEGQRALTRMGQIVAYEIPRSEEARAMIEALARWRWDGEKSWKFPGGQRHRRVVSKWLRQHRPEIIAALLPPTPPGCEPAMAHAVRVLAAAAMLRRASDHPPDRPGIVRELLMPLPNSRPSTDDDRAVSQIWGAQPKALEFLLGMLNVPQGGTRGGTIYIDPRPILKYADCIHKMPVSEPLDVAYTTGSKFWQHIYLGLQGTDAVANLPELLDARRTALLQLITRDVQLALVDARLDPGTLEESIITYCAQIAALLPVQASTFPRAHPEIEARRMTFGSKGKVWAQTLSEAQRAATGEGVVGLLTLNLAVVEDARSAMTSAHDFLQLLASDLTASEHHLIADGDPDVLLAQIKAGLQEIAAGGVKPDTVAVGVEV